MLAVPLVNAVTSPDELTVATALLLLLHEPVPPLKTTELELYVAVPPMHKAAVPVTDAILAFGLIVTVCWAEALLPQPPLMV